MKVKAYYRFLATNALELRESDFWQYHKQWLEKIGFPFDRVKLVKAILGRFIFKPMQSITAICCALLNKVKND
jgi:hypothetical protein